MTPVRPSIRRPPDVGRGSLSARYDRRNRNCCAAGFRFRTVYSRIGFLAINLETIFPWMNKWQVRFQSPPRCGRTRLIQTDPVRYALEERLPGGGVFDRSGPRLSDHSMRHAMVGEPGVWRRPGGNSGPLIQPAEIHRISVRASFIAIRRWRFASPARMMGRPEAMLRIRFCGIACGESRRMPVQIAAVSCSGP